MSEFAPLLRRFRPCTGNLARNSEFIAGVECTQQRGHRSLTLTTKNEREVEEKALPETPSQAQKDAGSFQVTEHP
uniref:Uncharacterized protein n=1 Tax=Mycena chlorophos TaxID=658473 RepID=A0ABQ0M1T2_MYCCL|nr:predicted protein [Mycena chlorophos]